MGAKLRLLVPVATTNYVKNPAARYDTTGISAVGSTVTRDLSKARFGIASFKVVTDGSALNEGFYYRVNALSGVLDIVTVSTYVRGSGYVRIRVIDNPAGKQYASKKVELLADRWQRIEVTGRASGSNDVRLYVETHGNAAQAITFWADGLQMELQEEATSYCDGDQPGCRWSLLEHGSASIRSAYTRAGGRWVEIAGPSCEEQDLYVTAAGGLGFAPLVNQVQPYADAPGDYFQSVKVLSRPLTLAFHAKRKNRPATKQLPSLKALHKLRQQLLDVIKPDRTAGSEPIILEYRDGETPLYLGVRYDGGMEGEWDVRNQFVNSFPVRFLAVSPFFTEDDQEVTELNIRSEKTVNYVLQRIDGEWDEMNGGLNALVRNFAIGSRGEVIAVGFFTVANNKATAIEPMIPANYIAWWDGEKWNQYGSGANGYLYDVAVAPNGDVYVVGNFTSIGGVAANYVAYWDDSADTWVALGTGLNAAAYSIAIAPNGDVYVGGDFTTAGGNTATRAARWDGSSWHPLGVYGGLNSYSSSIVISPDGTEVFFGGNFTDEATDPAILEINYVAVYYPDLNQFAALGVGFNTSVRKLFLAPSGRLYAVGDFTESNDTALVLLYAAYWNGASWYALGVGADDTVWRIDVSPLGEAVVSGSFNRIGGEDARYAALWNGSSYANLDVELDDISYAVKLDKQENIFLSMDGTLARWARITNVTNVGSAETHPKIYILGPCTIRWIENQTTKKRVYMDLDIQSGEEVVIDFAQGTVESTVRGNLAYAVVPGSDLRAWSLVPGVNKIAVLAVDDVQAKMYISYIPRHWSADATARVEDL